MTIDKMINLLAGITLIEMMLSVGLGVRLSEVLSAARTYGLAARALLANYLLVPAAAVGLLVFFHPAPTTAAGFLVAAVCAGAPYGPPFTGIAKGNVSLAVGLMVLLAGTSAFLAPLLLGLLFPLVARGAAMKIDVYKMVSTLIGAQLLPLGVGLLVRHRWPLLARRLAKPAGVLSLLLNLTTLCVILAIQGQMLLQIRMRGYFGMSCLVLMSMAAGWSMTRRGEDPRGMVLTTSVRNVGVALVIVTASFPGTPAITSATAYALFQTIVIAIVALMWGRFTPGVSLDYKHAA
jgi:BASS family bile acid:Na+ symporter